MEHNWFPLEFQLPDGKDALQTAQKSRLGSNQQHSVQHHGFLPQLFCSCLTRLKLAVCHTNNVVWFDPSLAQHFLIGTQHSSLTHLPNVGIALTGTLAQPFLPPKASRGFCTLFLVQGRAFVGCPDHSLEVESLMPLSKSAKSQLYVSVLLF